MPDQPRFNADQAVRAQRALREATGKGEELFPLPALVGMISDEMEAMRAARRSDQDVAEVVAKATGQGIDPADLARFYAAPEERRRG